MSFELLLMRHGHAEDWAEGGDSARELTERGRSDVGHMATLLAAMGIEWQASVSSPFTRARQTLELMGGDRTAPEVPELLSGAHPDETIRALLAVAAETEADCLLAVGHNPNITSTLGRLIVGDPGVYFSVATADVAHLWVEPRGPKPSAAVLGFYPAKRLRHLRSEE